MALAANILERIGNTALVELRRVRPAKGVRILIKLESENPTGSMKTAWRSQSSGLQRPMGD